VKLAPIAFAVVAGLSAGSISACSHGRCTPTGGYTSSPSCHGWNTKACATIPGCRWGTGCTVKVSCGEADQATCPALGYCEWTEGNHCEERSDPCVSLSGDDCTSDPGCMQAPACIGTPVTACETYDDEDTCEANITCDWFLSPAF